MSYGVLIYTDKNVVSRPKSNDTSDIWLAEDETVVKTKMLNFWENNYSVDRATFISAMLLGAKTCTPCSLLAYKTWLYIFGRIAFIIRGFRIDASLGGGLIAWELIQIWPGQHSLYEETREHDKALMNCSHITWAWNQRSRI